MNSDVWKKKETMVQSGGLNLKATSNLRHELKELIYRLSRQLPKTGAEVIHVSEALMHLTKADIELEKCERP
jgi:hypothetical protein